MSTTVLAPPKTNRPDGPEMSRVFETIADGHDYTVERVDGSLPSELRGTLYRNGPSRNEIDGIPFAHLFDGDGMLSQFVFSDGHLRYRNRFVRTTHYLGEQSAKLTIQVTRLGSLWVGGN